MENFPQRIVAGEIPAINNLTVLYSRDKEEYKLTLYCELLEATFRLKDLSVAEQALRSLGVKGRPDKPPLRYTVSREGLEVEGGFILDPDDTAESLLYHRFYYQVVGRPSFSHSIRENLKAILVVNRVIPILESKALEMSWLGEEDEEGKRRVLAFDVIPHDCDDISLYQLTSLFSDVDFLHSEEEDIKGIRINFNGEEE